MTRFTNVDGATFPTRQTSSEVRLAKSYLIQCNTRRRQLLAELAAGIRDRDPIVQSVATHRLVTETASRVAYTVRANKKLPLKNRATLESCLELPTSNPFLQPPNEVVDVWAEPKAKGGFRIFLRFGLEYKALQLLVDDIMSRHFVPRSWQFGHRGPHAAIEALRQELLTSPGHTFYAQYDIKNFYGSFHKGLSEKLPIPKGLADHVVLGQHLKVKVNKGRRAKAYNYGDPHYPSPSTLIGDARLGIPTGSICSPMVGNWVVSQLPWRDGAVALVSYVDNFLFLGPSQSGVSEAAAWAVEAVGNLPGGNFVLELRDQGVVTEEFDFLGHAVRKIQTGVTIRPSNGAQASLSTKFGELDGTLSGLSRPAALIKLAKMRMLISGWVAAFSASDDVERYVGEYRIYLKDWMSYYHTTEQELVSTTMDYPAAFDFDFSGVVVPIEGTAQAA